MKLQDCFFYTTNKAGEDYVVPLCLECNKKFNLGWFWSGSQYGFGPYLFKCEKCNKVIFDPNEREIDE